jgi:hypothetical protein
MNLLTNIKNYYDKKKATDEYIKEYDELLKQINDETPKLEEIINKYNDDNNISEQDLIKLNEGKQLIDDYNTKGMINRMENNRKVLDEKTYNTNDLFKHIYGNDLSNNKKKSYSDLLSKITNIIEKEKKKENNLLHEDINDKHSPSILHQTEQGGKKKSKTNKKRKNMKKSKRKSVKR